MTNPAFTGSIAELDSEFVTHVRHQQLQDLFETLYVQSFVVMSVV